MLKKNNLRPISKKLRENIEKYIPDIRTRPWYYPTKICSSCSFKLHLGDKSHQKVNVFTYKTLEKTSTRNSGTCNCEICAAARITLPNLHGKKIISKKRGRPSKNIKTIIKRCSECFSEIARGKQHTCTKTQTQTNLLSFVETKSVGDSVIATFMRNKQSNKEETVTLSNMRGLPSQWTPSCAVAKRKSPIISVDDMFLIKQRCDLSTRSTIKLSSALRGMDIEVSPNIPRSLTQLNKRLEQFFTATYLNFDTDATVSNISKPVIYCTNVNGLIEYIMEARVIDKDDILIKIGMTK